MPSLDGAKLKLDRAREHLNSLGTEISLFLSREPYAAYVDMDEESREIRFGIEVRERPDARLSVVIGEILHNLRSCLDHAAWELVSHEGGTPHSRTSFPIYLRPPGFDTELISTRRRVGALVGFNAGSVALLKSLQPFSTGEDTLSPLWQLHELNNFDKHCQLILGAGSVTNWVKLEVGPLEGGIVTSIVEDEGPYERDTVVARVAVPNWFQRAPDMDMDKPVEFGVTFGKATPTPGAPVIELLAACGKRVYECLERIESRFS